VHWLSDPGRDAATWPCASPSAIFARHPFETPEDAMANSPDELTIKYSEGGIDIVKELDKEVLSKGAWTTVVFRYQDWDPRKEEYSKDKYSIRRYQKRNGEYQQKSKFNISSPDQARQLIDALNRWMED
jgi:hypothetical protein